METTHCHLIPQGQNFHTWLPEVMQRCELVFISDSVDYLQLLKDKMTLWIGKEAVTHGKQRRALEASALASVYSVVYCVPD